MLFILFGVPEIRKYKKEVERLCFINRIEERIRSTATSEQYNEWNNIRSEYTKYTFSNLSFIKLYKRTNEFLDKYNIPENYVTFDNFLKRIESIKDLHN